MKVLHLIGGGDVGGAKTHVLSLVKELGREIDVKLISLRAGTFSDDARIMGINVEVVRSGNIIKDIQRIVGIINDEGYEIVHSHGAKANMFAVALGYFTNIPTVTTVHSDYRLDYLKSIFKMLSFGLINTASLRFIDYHIGVSRNFKEMLVKRNFDPDKIFTVYNGIDFNKSLNEYSRTKFAEKYHVELSDNDIVVGILARLHPVKGLSTYLQAAGEVLKQRPDVKFLIGGDGEERKSLERKAVNLGISDSVYFLGFVDDPYEFMSSIDINVLTSLSESFPYVILEGVRYKRATISSNVGGLSDLIESGENSYLFNPGDHKKLAEYLLNLIDDGDLRLEMGQKIYQKASVQFSMENMFKTQLGIYKTILEREYKIAKEKNYLESDYDVMISGYYGSGNIGDEAILNAIVNNLKSYKEDIKIVVLSRNPELTKLNYKVDAINRFNFLNILSYMGRTKLFINGGGSLIQDIKSTRSLMYYLGTMWMAKKSGLKVMVYANGIGPINYNANRMLATRVVNQVDVITLREESSLIELGNLNINKPKISVTADPAFSLDMADTDEKEIGKIFKEHGIYSAGPFIGFSVREWKQHEKFVEIIARTADYIIEKYKACPVFIPMQYPGDLTIIESIVSKMKGKGFIIRKNYGEACILGIIKRMDILVGMRLHALIFAACAGIPIIGLAYEQKVDWVLKHIRQVSAGNVNQLDFETLTGLIDTTWYNRYEIGLELKAIAAQLRVKALENAKIAVDLITD